MSIKSFAWNYKTVFASLLSGVLFSTLLLMISTAAISAEGTNVGIIKGKVNYCGKGGYLGMQVFIPGRQFMVLLGQDGKFLFENVPVGKYDINYVVNGRMVNVNKDISVRPGGTNDLGNIVFCAESDNKQQQAPVQTQTNPCDADPASPDCIDADKDGVVAAKDCDDNNPAIKPGAVEACDGIDNNCNGQIDESGIAAIANGIGSCDGAGKISIQSCNKGFDNCDGDSSNGCETNILNDPENCGSCGNECSALESCNVGIC